MSAVNQMSCIEQLNLANRRLHDLAQQTNTWMWETNADHIFTYFSNNLEKLTNLKICNLVGTNRLDAALTSEHDKWHKHAQHHLDQTPFVDFRYERITETGDVRHIIVSGWPLFDENNQFQGFRGTGRDETDEFIKANRQVEKEEHLLSEIESQRTELNTVLENLTQSVIWFDREGVIRLKNAQTAKIVGFEPHELESVNTIQQYLCLMAERGDFGDVDIEQEVEARANRLCEDLQEQHAYRIHLASLDRYIAVILKQLPDGSRILTQTDVTKEAKIKIIAQTRDKMMREIMSNMDYAVVLVDEDLNVDYANEQFCSMMNFDEKFMKSAPDMEVVFDKLRLSGAFNYPNWTDLEWRQFVATQRENILRNDGRSVERQMADGRTVVEKVTKLGSGKRMMTFVNITDQKQREETLSHILNAIDYGTLILDADLNVELANKPFSKLMKVKPKLLESKPNMTVVLDEMLEQHTIGYFGTTDEEWQKYRNDVCNWVKDANSEPTERLRADGKTILSGCLKLPGNKRLLTYFDVTEVKIREEALSTIINNVDQGVLLLDADLKVEVANEKFSQLWGMDEDFFKTKPSFAEIMGYNRNTGLYAVDGKDDVAWNEYVEGRIQGIKDDSFKSIEMVRGDGKTLIFSTVALPGDRRMATYFDITEIKQREEQLEAMQNDLALANELLEERVESRTKELKKTQASLVQKERQALLGDLVASLCHELRNPLNALNTSLFIIRRKVENDFPKLTKAFDRSERTIERCTHILDDLYDYALVDEMKPKPVELAPWLRREVEKAQVPMSFEIVFEVDENLQKVEIDEKQLGSAIGKLVTNAAQAIAAHLEPTSQPRIKISARLDGEKVRLIIEDNGPGMNDETFKKALEPLYSTRGFGVGLGLPIAQQTVKRHGGHLDLHTQEGEGTTVFISLPVSHDDGFKGKASNSYKPTLKGKNRAA